MSLGDNIKNARIKQGMPAEVLAEKIGVARSTLYRYEKGRIQKLPAGILDSIAKALHTTPEKLAGWDKPADEFTEAFRLAVKSIVENTSDEDIAATGAEKHELQHIIHGQEPIALETAFSVADSLGMSLDDILGRTPSLDEQLSDIDFALSGEIRELDDDEKRDILDYVRFRRFQKEGK